MNILKIKQFVNGNLKKIRSIRDIAKEFRVSGETLRRAFRRSTGQSLTTHVLHKRLRAMKHKLRTTDQRCFEIIYSVGFRREDSAARTFHKITGMTMERYRKKYYQRRGHRSEKRIK